MRIPGLVRFLFHSITAGLALAFVILVLKPELLQLPARVLAPDPQAAVPNYISPVPSRILSYADAVEAAADAVVNVHTAKVVVEPAAPWTEDPLFRQFFGDLGNGPRERLVTSLGSGVIVREDGHVITNHHLIRGADAVNIMLPDGRTAQAKLVGTDPESDVAVLKVDLDNLPLIDLGRSDLLRVGDVVLAIGNPFGVGQTVTQGIVSAVNRNRLGINTFENFIQTDAAINPGNSGGALISATGELVGINTAIVSRSGGAQGIGFAIPVATATAVMDEIIRNGAVSRGWLGIEADDLTAPVARALGLTDTGGIVVQAVLRDGPAARAGIRPGDVITRIAGQPVADSRGAIDLIAALDPGTHIQITLLREGKIETVEATVSRRPVLESS